MGRRARTRAKEGGPAGAKGTPRTDGVRRTGSVATARPRAQDPSRPRLAPGQRGHLDPVRRTLALFLVAAVVVAVLTLAGIVVLGGSLGPFVTFAVVLLAAAGVHRTAQARLAGAVLDEEDRMMQTLAGGMLLICVVLAAVSAVVSLVT